MVAHLFIDCLLQITVVGQADNVDEALEAIKAKLKEYEDQAEDRVR